VLSNEPIAPDVASDKDSRSTPISLSLSLSLSPSLSLSLSPSLYMYQNSLKRLRFYDYGISRVIYIVFIERKRGTRQEFGRWLAG
jgi:hypothetical protein